LFVPAARAVHLHNPAVARTPERIEWEAESFLRFGNRYYGERFMRHLFHASGRASVFPDWHLLDGNGDRPIRIEPDDECVWPIWVELTPSPFGFPAATTCVPEGDMWSLPTMRGLEFLDGTFYLQFVDDVGREFRRYRFQRSFRDEAEKPPLAGVCLHESKFR
jgi:hypothetical protein